MNLYINDFSELPPSQSTLLQLIHNLSHNYGFCCARNDSLCRMSGLKKKTIENALCALKKDNYITIYGGGNQYAAREIYVNVDILKKQQLDTQAFLAKQKQELDELAALRKQTEQMKQELAEKSREISQTQDEGEPSGKHRETIYNVPVTSDQLINPKKQQPVVVEHDISMPENKEESCSDSELSALAETFQEHVSPPILSKIMRDYNTDGCTLTIEQLRDMLLTTAGAEREKTFNAYLFGLLKKHRRGEYEFAGGEEPYRYTGNRNLTEAEREADQQRQAEALRIVAQEAQGQDKSEDEYQEQDGSGQAVTGDVRTPEEVVKELERMLATKRAYYNSKINELKRNHAYWGDVYEIGAKEIGRLQEQLDKVKNSETGNYFSDFSTFLEI